MDDIMENIQFVKAEMDWVNYHYSKKTADLVCKIGEDIYTDKIRIIYFYLPNIKTVWYNKGSLSEVEKLLSL